ncbi:heat shock 70 kDa protein 4L [Trichonephila inaurata madagascariensis]|uniref:Heat shock 70 kDa protein 4L n=1 Tax=Trichonephila inaurata madagascariensis TaxID=2747483 RepID=A0A8X6MGX5_9ARAC|nr:heat shock 70 kDa protein 4L [Trichonephila inaurata madagascariensis]
MSAVGIDFGNETCYVAVARAGGLETITNDYSQRATPSYVAFGPTCRELGTSAKNKVITNLKNTISGFKRLIGKKYQDRALQHELSYLPYEIHELPNGSVGVKVSYLGNDSIFTVQQIAAMLLTKLKDITEAACKNKVTDCVISVPVFYNDAERRAMLDVCKIANLNVLRLLNETTAVALAYGFYRQDLSDTKPKRVVFVDIGHSAVQSSVCEFFQGRLKVLCSTWDFCVGGRDVDNCMVRHFSQEFKTKYNLNVLSNQRAIIRLLQECEKLKKNLSANPQVLPLNIECFMDDKDVSSSLGRDKLEELCADTFRRIEEVFKRLLHETGLTPNDIHCVELVGGSTRIPAIKNIIKNIFGMEPSTTLNQDEAVARGCALQAAMLSPGVKVRDFHITDVQPYTIKLMWTLAKNEKGEIEAYQRNHPVPFSKLLTFFRREDFVLNAFYFPGKENESFIGSFAIKNVHQLPSGESVKIIIKLRINIHGIFQVCSAVIADKDSKENISLDQKTEDLLDSKPKNAVISPDPIVSEEKKNFFSLKKHKRTPQEIELQIDSKVPQLSESEIKTFIESEMKMIHQDSSEEKRINAKNSVEEYVYDMRSKLSDELKQYIDKQEYDDFLHKLNQTEEWIYDEDQNEAEYKEKLSELKSMADPVFERKFGYERKSFLLEEFHNMLVNAKNILKAFMSGDEMYSHIEPKDMEQVQRIVDENEQWLQLQLKSLEELKMQENYPVSIENIVSQKEKLKEAIFPILNKPKPQVEAPSS